MSNSIKGNMITKKLWINALSAVFLAVLVLTGCGSSSSNENTAFADTTSPVIQLIGSSEVFLYTGETYTEEGATAWDGVDGDVSVIITGSVDTSIENTYIVKYTAADTSGNSAEEERTVTVLKKEGTDKTTIDVLALYSSAVGADDGETKISHVIAEANRVEDSSGTGIYYNLVGMLNSPIVNDADTLNENLKAITYSDEIKALATEYNADIVVSYQTGEEDDLSCGIAWLNGYDGADMLVEQSYSSVNIDCPSDTTVHEFGHNLGLAHSHRQTNEGEDVTGKYSYSFGHAVQDNFSTIMVYSYVFNATPIAVRSNPESDECHGEPCGIDEGEEGEADAVKTLIQTREIVSGFR